MSDAFPKNAAHLTRSGQDAANISPDPQFVLGMQSQENAKRAMWAAPRPPPLSSSGRL